MLKILLETPFLIFKHYFDLREIVRPICNTIIIHVAHPYICKNNTNFWEFLAKLLFQSISKYIFGKGYGGIGSWYRHLGNTKS